MGISPAPDISLAAAVRVLLWNITHPDRRQRAVLKHRQMREQIKKSGKTMPTSRGLSDAEQIGPNASAGPRRWRQSGKAQARDASGCKSRWGQNKEGRRAEAREGGEQRGRGREANTGNENRRTTVEAGTAWTMGFFVMMVCSISPVRRFNLFSPTANSGTCQKRR